MGLSIQAIAQESYEASFRNCVTPLPPLEASKYIGSEAWCVCEA